MMSRRKLIAANWKMHKTISEAESFCEALTAGLAGSVACDLLVIPPFLAVPAVAGRLAGADVAVGAQDLFWEAEGAFTGEVSGAMIRDAGASFALVGHSERRHVLGEDDEIVARKLRSALAAGLTPILCVGETIEQREAGRQGAVVSAQLQAALGDLSAEQVSAIVIAYEPVWAIGTGRTATPEDAVEMHQAIRAYVETLADGVVAERVRIQYGGSVKPDNAAELLAQDDIDGALVGGASLSADSFLAIARAVPT